MATVITKTIGAAGDYTTAALWDAGAGTVYADNLVTNDVIWKGTYLEKVTPAGSTTIDGSTTDSTRYKWLTAASGQSWQELLSTSRIGGDISGAGNYVTSGSTILGMSVNDDYTVVENITMISTSSASPTHFFSLAGTGAVVRNCYMRQRAGSAAGSPLVKINASNTVFMNNFMEIAGTSTADELLRLEGGTGTDGADVPVIANNTFLVTSTDVNGTPTAERNRAIELNGAGTRYFRLVNNAFIGVATLFTGTSTMLFATGSGNNMTTLAAGSTDYTDRFPIATSGNLYAADITGTWSDSNNVLVNTTYAASDMRAYSTGILANAGATVTTPTHPAGAGGATQYDGLEDLDAYGNARNPTTPWIGAWEDPYAGGGGSAALMFHLRRLMRR